jgi:hypothetical protein
MCATALLLLLLLLLLCFTTTSELLALQICGRVHNMLLLLVRRLLPL